MPQLFVEGWAPEYGAAVDPDDDLSPAEGSVDTDVEGRPWEPIPGSDDGIPIVAFVDGVRRIDARLVLDHPDDGPVPGLCGSYGVGAVLWRRHERRAELTDPIIERVALLGGGHLPSLPASAPAYRPVSVADDDPSSLIRIFHDEMRRAEARITEELAASGYFVVADGPLYEYTDTPKMGYVKSHRRSYLEGDHGALITRLPAGHRTPVFAFGQGGFRRYSWYVRLADRGAGHSWAAIARCEASAQLGLDSVVTIADRSAAVLPTVGSEAHIDPRAPQNLVPIAALERDLRHRLGDAGLVYRALRAAVMEAA